jgi:hypothetical protein
METRRDSPKGRNKIIRFWLDESLSAKFEAYTSREKVAAGTLVRCLLRNHLQGYPARMPALPQNFERELKRPADERRGVEVKVPMEADLHTQLKSYIGAHQQIKLKAAAILRSLVRNHLRSFPTFTPLLPKGIDKEKKRPSRQPKRGSNSAA